MIRGGYDDPYRYSTTSMEALRLRQKECGETGNCGIVSIWVFPYTMCANCYKYTKIPEPTKKELRVRLEMAQNGEYSW